MFAHIINSAVYLLIALAISTQVDELGELLVHGHLALYAATLAAYTMFFYNLTKIYDLMVKD